MIYRSNLSCPDLTPHFKHLVSSPMPHSFGHDVPRDWGDKADDDPVFGPYKRCGFWTHDEAAILYNVVAVNKGKWCDIGAHTGWTGAHILAAGAELEAVDPLLQMIGFASRFEANLDSLWGRVRSYSWLRSSEFLHYCGVAVYDGFCIDGSHDDPDPLIDAVGAARHLANTGVVIFHDFIGQPVREAVTWLMNHGFRMRLYYTPHLVACCWRGDFKPPDHVPDPELLPRLTPHIAAMKDFDFRRCE